MKRTQKNHQKTQKKKLKPSATKTQKPLTQSESEAAFEEYKPYLVEMRHAAWKVLLLFSIGAVIGMGLYKSILGYILGYFQLEGINIVLTSPYQFIDLSINTGFFIGVIFALPIFLYYLLKFTKPALLPKEYKILQQMMPASIVLFVVGFIFGVWVLQYVVDHFQSTSTNLSIENIWDISNFLSQVMIMGIALAFIFQMPIVLTSLIKLNILKIEAIKKKRRVVYAGILIFAALMPPTDMVALVILSVVPLLLFEATMLMNKLSS